MKRWKSYGGTWVTGPHAVALDADSLAVFAVGTDHALNVRWRAGQEWGPWERLGGTFITPPFALARPGQVDVFAVSQEHAIHHTVWRADSWTDWQPLQRLNCWGLIMLRRGGVITAAGRSMPVV